MSVSMYIVCACLQSTSNKSTGYGMSEGDHSVA